jgi:hypothetical protein
MTSDVLSLSLKWTIDDNEEATFERLLSRARPRCSPNFLEFGQIYFREECRDSAGISVSLGAFHR